MRNPQTYISLKYQHSSFRFYLADKPPRSAQSQTRGFLSQGAVLRQSAQLHGLGPRHSSVCEPPHSLSTLVMTDTEKEVALRAYG